MRKKLLFILPTFGIGGTTVSTRNLLSLLDKKKYDVTVWCLDGEGLLKGLYDEIPQLKTTFFFHALSVSSWKSEDGWINRIFVSFLRQTRRVPVLYHFLIRCSISKVLNGKHFDTVIACQEGLTSLLVAHVPAKRVAWVRCDYKFYQKSHGINRELHYREYQHIVCVAEQAKKSFTDVYPEWKDKTVCIYNPQDSNLILSQATIDDHDSRFRTDKTVIISMGRLSSVKRFVHIPDIAQVLKKQGMDFYWYIIGDGAEKQAISNAITQNNVDDCVIMLGAKSNPHFYIKHAALYVCLSISEACPRVINEAKILGTPVVSTNFPTIYEYLQDGVNGRIVSLESVPKTIIEMLTDNNLYNHIKENISSFTFDNSHLVEQLEEIL